jgi:hypothetical protein
MFQRAQELSMRHLFYMIKQISNWRQHFLDPQLPCLRVVVDAFDIGRPVLVVQNVPQRPHPRSQAVRCRPLLVRGYFRVLSPYRFPTPPTASHFDRVQPHLRPRLHRDVGLSIRSLLSLLPVPRHSPGNIAPSPPLELPADPARKGWRLSAQQWSLAGLAPCFNCSISARSCSMSLCFSSIIRISSSRGVE